MLLGTTLFQNVLFVNCTFSRFEIFDLARLIVRFLTLAEAAKKI